MRDILSYSVCGVVAVGYFVMALLFSLGAPLT